MLRCHGNTNHVKLAAPAEGHSPPQLPTSVSSRSGGSTVTLYQADCMRTIACTHSTYTQMFVTRVQQQQQDARGSTNGSTILAAHRQLQRKGTCPVMMNGAATQDRTCNMHSSRSPHAACCCCQAVNDTCAASPGAAVAGSMVLEQALCRSCITLFTAQHHLGTFLLLAYRMRLPKQPTCV